MTESITGIISPVLTPFDEHGKLKSASIAESVEYTISCGCHAIVAAGTGVQETSALSPTERKRVISETVTAVDGRVPVIAGASYPALSIVADLMAHAEDEGADALLVMPPWGIKPTQQEIVTYYEYVAENAAVPVLAYNNPGVTVDMTRETMREIATLEGIEYVKESLRDWRKLAWLFEEIHHAGHAAVFSTMDVLLPTLMTVGTGVVTPAPLSAVSMEIYDAYHDGDIDRAITVQRSFGDFPPEPADRGLIPVCKAATNLAGVDVGDPRPPYEPLPEAGRRAIDAWMDDVGVPRQ